MSLPHYLPRSAFPVCSGGEAPCPYQEEVLSLREQVRTDPLTGLYNSAYFREALAQEMERTVRTCLPTALIMLDLDFFKKVNDHHGHEAGNAVLQQTAKIICEHTRKLDIQCRYGGEEFAIILPSTERMLAIQVAHRLCKNLAAAPVFYNEQLIPVSASIGLAFYSADENMASSELIALADQYLYMAKNNGRNQVRFPPSLPSESTVNNEEKEALKNLFS